jgi:predicted DCC family thiol-disulfide oxidoreductase YuxK
MAALKVYYNSACPVCKAGIEGQVCALREQGVESVEWLDVHADPKLATEVGAELETVRERLHVVDESGQVRVGSDAFAALFAVNRERRWLGRLLELPVLRQACALAYNAFARLLYWWNRASRHW